MEELLYRRVRQEIRTAQPHPASHALRVCPAYQDGGYASALQSPSNEGKPHVTVGDVKDRYGTSQTLARKGQGLLRRDTPWSQLNARVLGLQAMLYPLHHRRHSATKAVYVVPIPRCAVSGDDIKVQCGR